MEDNPYFVTLTPEEFHWLWEDIDSALQSAQRTYGTIKLLKGLKTAFEKADKKHVCIDEINQSSS